MVHVFACVVALTLLAWGCLANRTAKRLLPTAPVTAMVVNVAAICAAVVGLGIVLAYP